MLTGLFKQAWRGNLIVSWQFVVALVEGSILSFVPVVKMIPCMLFFLYSQSFLEHCVLTNKPSKSFFFLCHSSVSIRPTDLHWSSETDCILTANNYAALSFIWQKKMCLVKTKKSMPVTCYLCNAMIRKTFQSLYITCYIRKHMLFLHNPTINTVQCSQLTLWCCIFLSSLSISVHCHTHTQKKRIKYEGELLPHS